MKHYYCAARVMSAKIIGVVSAEPEYLEIAAKTVEAWKSSGLTVSLYSEDIVNKLKAEYGF